MGVYSHTMERKADFIECPKCGLRNKPTAVQCDFCGQSLIPSDDWQKHVKDLESISKTELRRPVDDRTFRRIESTIIRKETNHHKELEVVEVGSLESILKEIDHVPPIQQLKVEEREDSPSWDVQSGSAVSAADEAVTDKPTEASEVSEEPSIAFEKIPSEPMMFIEEIEPIEEEKEVQLEGIPETDRAPPSEEEQAEVEPPPEIVDAVMVPEAAVATTAEEPGPISTSNGEAVEGQAEGSWPVLDQALHEPVPTQEPEPAQRPWRRLLRSGKRTAMAVLVLGAALYLTILTAAYLGALGTVNGLVGGAVSSAMIVYGAAITFPSLRRKDPDEVFICPNCHETVGKNRDRCPACGIIFSPED